MQRPSRFLEAADPDGVERGKWHRVVHLKLARAGERGKNDIRLTWLRADLGKCDYMSTFGLGQRPSGVRSSCKGAKDRGRDSSDRSAS
jgi:hypothetical protein